MKVTFIDRRDAAAQTERVANEDELKKKIKDLEGQLSQKDQDLKIYKKELSEANVQLERLIVQVNDQLQQAHKIQKFLVPTEFPNIPGFDFSTKFSSSSLSGGDYFDIFEHYDKMRFGLFLSSASGYGMSALFLSVLMKLTYQIEDSKNNDPLSVMKDVLGEMKAQCSIGDQAGIFYGVFDRRKFQMSYCNMGQPLAVYFQAETGKIELLPGSEPFIAGDDPIEGELGVKALNLNPNDKLIFCSSGFLALENSRGDHWGLDEILSVIKRSVNKSVHELRNEIFYQASKFSTDQPKDLTVIVTEVKERIMKLA